MKTVNTNGKRGSRFRRGRVGDLERPIGTILQRHVPECAAVTFQPERGRVGHEWGFGIHVDVRRSAVDEYRHLEVGL